MGSHRVAVVEAGAAVVGVVASVVMSAGALYYAHEANQLAKENQELQGEHLQLAAGFVSLWFSGASDWVNVGPVSNDAGPVHIAMDQWRSATRRSLTVRMYNDGQKDAVLRGFYLPLKDGTADTMKDQVALAPLCGATNVNMGPCPDVVVSDDGYSLALTIPVDYVNRVDDNLRQKGITVCAARGNGAGACTTIPVIIDR